MTSHGASSIRTTYVNYLKSRMRVKGIIGAVIGDIVGSSHEFGDVSSPKFKLFNAKDTFTDDTVLTVAVADALLSKGALSFSDAFLRWGREYPHAGYGRGFKAFLKSGRPVNPGSTHNGSAMRVSPVGFMAASLEECLENARLSALPSHNTRGAIAGAQALSTAVYLARTGSSKDEIRAYIEKTFGYDLGRSYGEVRADVQSRLALRDTDHDRAHELLLSAETTVQDALTVFLVADGFEGAVRLAVYLGGDADTYGAMAGAVASAYWGVPEELAKQALVYIPDDMLAVINRCDGTSWEPSRITPPNTHRWRTDDIVVYGTNSDGTDGEQGFYDVRPTRFNRHVNSGYGIVTIGSALEQIREQVALLEKEATSHPDKRYLIREIGISKAGYTVGQIAPMFTNLSGMKNVRLPDRFIAGLRNQ